LKDAKSLKEMVLPNGIEPSTLPLPRRLCSYYIAAQPRKIRKQHIEIS
jgi:hypothetical protein